MQMHIQNSNAYNPVSTYKISGWCFRHNINCGKNRVLDYFKKDTADHINKSIDLVREFSEFLNYKIECTKLYICSANVTCY